ncbi:MAG: ribosome biogenesis GTP-binding protein YihA/YsxC [Candidatus Latescibacterota bacterium]
MRILSAEFVTSAVRPHDLPDDGLPEVALAGRSNVGKSSLINRVLQRRNLARTSSTPGKTQQLNYYRINDRFYLVDLPGYGYMHGGTGLRTRVGRLTERYLSTRRELRAVLQLVDARHGPTELDRRMLEWLRERQTPFLLVFTKADKVSRSQLDRQLGRLEAGGELAGVSYVSFSAQTGQGRQDVLGWILDLVAGAGAGGQEPGQAAPLGPATAAPGGQGD